MIARAAAVTEQHVSVRSGVTDALAALLVIFVLLLPNQLGQLRAGAFLSVPVEGLFGAALLLLMPARARPATSLVLGLALGLLTIVKIIDLGFSTVLDRPFDPLLDWPLLGNALDFAYGSFGALGAIGAVLAAGILAAAVLLAVTLAVVRLSRTLLRRPALAVRAVPVLAALWVTSALFGAQVVPGTPAASWGSSALVSAKVIQAVRGVQDRRTFAEQTAADSFGQTAGAELLGGLRGKDVVLVFVESYGRNALEEPELAPPIDRVLDGGTRRLDAAGFSSRSAFLSSSTFGGGSWLAHATLLSGLWIDNQQRYRLLVDSDRMTLSGAFQRAGWRTVGVMPGLVWDWPEGEFFDYDEVYGAARLGYRGPNFSWATMPDQYTLAAFERLEHRRSARTPVMSVIPLVSSHAPWSPTPRLIDWRDVGDGTAYHAMAGPAYPAQAILTRDPARVRVDYRHSLEYSLATLVSYVESYGDDDLVFIFMGDHQPSTIVTGPVAPRDVPISIVARDPAVLDQIADWRWDKGLNPGSQAPVWPMDAFRNRFLTAFGEPLRGVPGGQPRPPARDGTTVRVVLGPVGASKRRLFVGLDEGHHGDPEHSRPDQDSSAGEQQRLARYHRGHREVHRVAHVAVQAVHDEPFGRRDRSRRTATFVNELGERADDDHQPERDQHCSDQT